VPNIAFTTLVILILAVPGYVCRSVYFSGEFTRQLLPRSWTDDIAKAILYSVSFHVLWIAIFEFLQHLGWVHHSLDVEIVLRLLAGEYGNAGTGRDDGFTHILRSLAANKFYLILYYGLVLVTALLVGLGIRRLVWKKELDVKWSWLRYRSDWLYRLMGRGQMKGVPHDDVDSWIDVLTDQPTEVPGKALLYRGLVAGFTTEEDGSLRDLVLTSARRGEFRVQDGDKREFEWTLIPGDFFVLSYSRVKNMNITYFQHSAVEADLRAPWPAKDGEPVPTQKTSQASRPSPALEPDHGSGP
jgi:hypothetical protein